MVYTANVVDENTTNKRNISWIADNLRVEPGAHSHNSRKGDYCWGNATHKDKYALYTII